MAACLTQVERAVYPREIALPTQRPHVRVEDLKKGGWFLARKSNLKYEDPVRA